MDTHIYTHMITGDLHTFSHNKSFTDMIYSIMSTQERLRLVYAGAIIRHKKLN